MKPLILKIFRIIALCCCITTLHAMQNDKNAFADHMIGKWKDAGLTTFDPFVLKEQDWLNDEKNLEPLRYLPLRHKTYFQNAKLREFFVKTCKQNPQEARALRERFTDYQNHVKTRFAVLESKRLVTSEQTQEINKFIDSILDILQEALTWNDSTFMEGIIDAFWQQEPDITKLEPFILRDCHWFKSKDVQSNTWTFPYNRTVGWLVHSVGWWIHYEDIDSVKHLVNRNKRYLKNETIRAYLIKRCLMDLEKTALIKTEFLKYQEHMKTRLQELRDQDLIDVTEFTAIKEYISSVLAICDTALQNQKPLSFPAHITKQILRNSTSWKGIALCAVVALGIAYYFHARAKAPQESTTK